MKIDSTGKLAIVTGSTAGVGLAIARGLAATGARVVVTGRTEARVQYAIEDISGTAPGAELEGVAADLTTAAGAATLAERVTHADILVNNLGTAEPKPFNDLTDDDWLRRMKLPRTRHTERCNVCSTPHNLTLNNCDCPGLDDRNAARTAGSAFHAQSRQSLQGGSSA